MKLTRIKPIHILLSAFVAALLSTSCKSYKGTMEYFTDIDTMDLTATGDYLLKIEPSDELIITVSSKNPAATSMYNLPYINATEANNVVRGGLSEQQTYVVDTQGNINFPVIGKVHVQGLTVEQLEQKLTSLISKEVDDPIVTVTLRYFTVVVAGEVMRPGRQNIYAPRYTILDALGSAGDLNQYGRRDNVLVIREVDGKRIHGRLDLNSAEVLNSPFYYLKQNDYIYVEPNDVRKDNAEYSQYNSYKLSVVSVIVSSSASIISLIIALTR